jgi:hypothetical protein
MIIYLLKVKGVAKIPDYVQIRDENYTLTAYFRLDRPEKQLKKAGLEAYEKLILDTIHAMNFGTIKELELIKNLNE